MGSISRDSTDTNGAWRFHRVSDARVHEGVVDQITFAIRAGIYKPGDRLPSIENLAQTMGVSKPTIGEAIKVLATSGVLEARRGATGGVHVISDNVPVTLLRMGAGWREAALMELVEARRPIETQIALLAGVRATDEDFATMRAAVAELARNRPESGRPRWRQADHLFHYAMGRAARSELLAYYQHQILERLAILLDRYYQDEEDPDLNLDMHRETLAAIESRDPDRIREVMDRHLRNLEELAEKWELTAGGDSEVPSA